MNEIKKRMAVEFPQTPAPVEIRGEWLPLTKVLIMLHNLFCRATLIKMANRGDAPFYIRRIGTRYYARRDDVERYIKEINNNEE